MRTIGSIKVPMTPEFFLAKMKLRQTHKKNLAKFSVCDIFKGFKDQHKVAEI